MEDHITIKPALAEKFKTAMRQSRVIFFSAPCGFGKSTTAEYLLSGRKISRVDAGQQPLALPDPGDRWEILLLDHFQQLQDEPDQQALCELIRNYPDRRFVLLSRGVAPGWLLPFQIAGLMTTFNTKDFQLDRDTTAALMASYGISPENLDLTAIHRETMGYPVAVIIVARAMADGRPYSPDLDSDVRAHCFTTLKIPSTAASRWPYDAFCWSFAPSAPWMLTLPGSSAVITMPGNCWQRCKAPPPCFSTMI